MLVPTQRYATRAIEAGARHLAFVLSVSEKHNYSNVRRSVSESVNEYAAIVALAPADVRIRLNVATAFDCPYESEINMGTTMRLLERLIPIKPDAEVALCDTTGRVTPERVRSLFLSAQETFSSVRDWAFHGHDTYGLGVANVLAAWYGGVRIFDSSIAGLGGCPFAPGATGNVATEDLLWMFSGMEVGTGIDLQRALATARTVAALPGAQVGGRVREAVNASASRCNSVAA